MKARTKREHAAIARTERHWAADALKDARYNCTQARRDFHTGNRLLGEMHEREANWDVWWAQRRLRIARKNS